MFDKFLLFFYLKNKYIFKNFFIKNNNKNNNKYNFTYNLYRNIDIQSIYKQSLSRYKYNFYNIKCKSNLLKYF